MADKDVEQTGEQGYGPEPWWADLGTWGSIALIVFGGLAALILFRLPGTPQELAAGYHGAAKVIAIGLVMVGCTLLNGRGNRAAATEDTR
ncbi:hypothetical protein [Streptomyces spectabilis]|uniref:Uncharacterized protein n=1 Tax=Streptomyces spectabilis TaxID=68270 RepID=A0A5P2WYN4_STRST|nr:hypothetical protein [Streptomyces spectabilis]MBB5101069.1 hypothetical protein [Streptomyces spectabilis]MCI3900279.1 hypothetical protein [Streptomyces spectabilis]QEV57877.1 hypothetical protein CP982_03405 [Streptomyces spectabilis]GGV09177.1 hypothetical protein GCM10010245_17420 [Streptomyces spectabilis]